jgi:hypothetical protein
VYQKILLGLKRSRRVRLRASPPTVSRLSIECGSLDVSQGSVLGASTSHKAMGWEPRRLTRQWAGSLDVSQGNGLGASTSHKAVGWEPRRLTRQWAGSLDVSQGNGLGTSTSQKAMGCAGENSPHFVKSNATEMADGEEGEFPFGVGLGTTWRRMVSCRYRLCMETRGGLRGWG